MPDVFSRLPIVWFRLLWGVTLIALVALIVVQKEYGRHLTTAVSPSGIVSLELAGSQTRTQAIFDEWGPFGAEATRQVWWDFPFILAYALVIAHGCGWAGRSLAAAWGWRSLAIAGVVLGWLAWLAGGCDVLEDVGLLAQLHFASNHYWAALARGCAVVKFALLFVVCLAFTAGGVTVAWKPLGAYVKYAATHLAYVFFLVLLYGFIYGLIGASFGIPSLFWNDVLFDRLWASCGATLFLLVIGVVVYHEQRDLAGGLVQTLLGPPAAVPMTPPENLAYFVRFLLRGGLPFLVLLAAPALAPSWVFPNIPRTYAPDSGTLPSLWTRCSGSWVWLIGIALGVVVAGPLVWLSKLFHKWLSKLFKTDPDNNLWAVLTFYGIFIVVYLLMGLLSWIFPAAFAICALLSVLVMGYALVAYFDEMFFPWLKGWWFPPKVVLLVGLLVWIGCANLDPYKLKFPNLGPSYDSSLGGRHVPLRHVVDHEYFTKGVPPALPVDGATLIDDDQALSAWLKFVPKEQGKPPKLVVVVVSGGGTRSAYWSATVLQRLEVEIPDFSKRVRLIAGASGGMLGTACYVEELRLRQLPGAKIVDFQKHVKSDSITPLARDMALHDLVRGLLPVRWSEDRGVALEGDWAFLKQRIQSYVPWEEQGKLPSLVFSPMLVDDGRQLLISNLDLRAICKAQGGQITESDPGINEQDYSLPAIEFFRIFPHATCFELRTAVRMNGSFPYVLPAVNLPTDPPRRVVDAGYYDNYGVQVAAAWLRKNLDWLTDPKHISGVVLVQVRDAVSQKDRLEVADAPGGTIAAVGRGFQFFTSPPEGAEKARYTVSAFRNDRAVEYLGDLFTARTKSPSFFTTVVFENSAIVSDRPRPPGSWPGDTLAGQPSSGEVALDWYISEAERAGLDTAIPAKPVEGSPWHDMRNRLDRINWLRKKVERARGTERDRWFKELEQARNFERLVQLKVWWQR